MIGDIEMQNLAAAVFENKKYEQDFQPDCWHGEEIRRYDFAQVILQKRLPGLGRWPRNGAQHAGHGAL